MAKFQALVSGYYQSGIFRIFIVPGERLDRNLTVTPVTFFTLSGEHLFERDAQAIMRVRYVITQVVFGLMPATVDKEKLCHS